MTILCQTQSFLFKNWSCFWFILIYLTSGDFFFVLVATENYPKQYKNRTQDCHHNENYKFFLVHLDAYSFKAALINYVGNGYLILNINDILDLFWYWGRPSYRPNHRKVINPFGPDYLINIPIYLTEHFNPFKSHDRID